MQAIHDPDRGAPLSYFHRTGPIGQAFLSLPAISQAPEIAVVGLGVGSLGAYAGPGQHWTFYEIDPAIERIARDPHLFTYLRDCGSRCSTVIGDARLSLTKARPSQFGLIVLDAFSSDAIPLHLLTEQALDLYLTRLDRHGILAFHISNRHLALGPVLGRLARTHGLVALEQQQDVSSGIESGKASSDWMIMARDEADLRTLTSDPRWIKPAVSRSTPLWTDDFTNMLSVVKFRRN
jgi:spermidine synthase